MLKTHHMEKYVNALKIGIDSRIKELSILKENLCLNCVDIICIKELTNNEIPFYLKEYKNKSMLYIIRADRISENCKIKMAEIKAKKELSMSLINEDNFKSVSSDNVCLYVGSSHNIYKRLLEHIGLGHKKTYALCLNKWWDKNEPIQIELFELLNSKNDDLQLIEDLLWSQNRPLFGKQGKK